MYEILQTVVTIAFFAVAGIAIVTAIMKKNKSKKGDDENT